MSICLCTEYQYRKRGASHTQRRPLDAGGGTVDAENYQSWFPDTTLLRPDVGITILKLES